MTKDPKYRQYQTLVERHIQRVQLIKNKISENHVEIAEVRKQLTHALANDDDSSELKQKLRDLMTDLEFLKMEQKAVEGLELNIEIEEAQKAAYQESFENLVEGRKLFQGEKTVFEELTKQWLKAVKRLYEIRQEYELYKNRCDALQPENLKRHHPSVGAEIVPRLHQEFFFLDPELIERVFAGEVDPEDTIKKEQVYA